MSLAGHGISLFLIVRFSVFFFSDFDWVWDGDTKSFASYLKPDSREVVFHVDYSCGTAAVRGTIPMVEDQYYWEVKMTTPVYGTDMVRKAVASPEELSGFA